MFRHAGQLHQSAVWLRQHRSSAGMQNLQLCFDRFVVSENEAVEVGTTKGITGTKTVDTIRNSRYETKKIVLAMVSHLDTICTLVGWKLIWKGRTPCSCTVFKIKRYLTYESKYLLRLRGKKLNLETTSRNSILLGE